MKKPYYDLSGIENNFDKLYGQNDGYQTNRYKNLFSRFKSSFGYDCCYIASSSGRVEVCGNHTDHNGGKVVSCGISLDTLAMFMPNGSSVVRIKSEGYPDIVCDLEAVDNEKKGTSAALVRGVAVALNNKGYKVGGFDSCMTSNVIGGAGISSSASFEVLIAEVFNFLFNDGVIDNETKAKVAQFAENTYFGKPCGLLDQTAIAFGGLKVLDFSDVNHIKVTDIKNNLNGLSLFLIDTGGSHANLTEEYAAIPYEMKLVASYFGKGRLIDVGEENFYNELPKIYGKLPDRAINRAIHFFSENKRVDKLACALNNNDYDTFLACVKESGVSSLCRLQNCYVAGSLDQSIPKALAVAEHYLRGGANRVHGGGFAGTILNIVKTEYAEDFVNVMKKIFGEKAVIPFSVRSVGTIVL